MNSTDSTLRTRLKVGIFCILGLLGLGAITVYVNDRPYWWRPCQLVHINVDDATGLRMKSPVRSLGIQIGFLRTVELAETYVTLGICVTAPVEILPATRAYVRSDGFLGDKFVELKPVKFTGPSAFDDGAPAAPPVPGAKSSDGRSGDAIHIPAAKPVDTGAMLFDSVGRALGVVLGRIVTDAQAQDAAQNSAPTVPIASPLPEAPAKPAVPARRAVRGAGKEIPVGTSSQDIQALASRVDNLVNEITGLTTNLKAGLNPDDMRKTIQQLNKTLENASRTLSPESGLNQTAQRTLAKLEDAIEQLRAQITRVNQGQGSVGMLLNDPTYAEEIRLALRNVNKLLNKVSDVRFVIDVGGEKIRGYESGRGYFQLAIWPKRDRYYLLGLSLDPRGRRTETTTTTTVGGQSVVSHTEQVEETGILFTAQLGKMFYDRLETAIGVIHGDGAITLGVHLGPSGGREDMLVIKGDTYSRAKGEGLDERLSVIIRPFEQPGNPFASIYVRGGLESTREVGGKIPMFVGAGISFDDEDIKLLFALVGAGR